MDVVVYMRLSLCLLLVVPFCTFAQSFDVASVKPSAVGVDGSTSDLQPGRFRGTNRTVEWMMRIAYGVQAAQISGGPSWIRTSGFDVEGRAEYAQSRIAPLLRDLLEDRFQLKVHRESRSAPVYTLVPAKGGPKLKAETSVGEMSMNNSIEDGRMVLQAKNIDTKTFAGFLAKQLGRPVTNKVDLPGVFNIRLEWAPEQDTESTAGSIFSAIQEQLGLKLETQKGTVDLIVIDSIAHPSAN